MMSPSDPPMLLAIDSASPIVSVAVSAGEKVLAQRSMAMAHSSEALLRSLDEALAEAGAKLGELDGMVALRGPGSFTGLRVGLSTLLGLHQALDVPATAVGTLEVLRLAAPDPDGRVATVVDALRGEWFVQLFDRGIAVGTSEIRTPEGVLELDPDVVVGHGIERFGAGLPERPPALVLTPAGELAPLALRLVSRHPPAWDPGLLLSPLYLRPPAAQAAAT